MFYGEIQLGLILLISFNFFRDAFGIAFDIDGVVLRSEAPIGGSPRAFRRLYDDSGTPISYTHLPIFYLSGN